VRVLDLFAGLEGWSAPFRERGHEVCSTDIDTRFDVDIHADILELVPADLPWRPDLVLASPPCESFSTLRIGYNWTGPKDDPPHQPKTDAARLALRIVERTRWLIEELNPAYFVIENPRAKLRKLPVVQDWERQTVTYCQFGEPFMKPTDLWGGFPPSLELPPPCKNGDPCHIRAGRGSTTGIQGSGVIVVLEELRARERERQGREHLTRIEQAVLARLDELEAAGSTARKAKKQLRAGNLSDQKQALREAKKEGLFDDSRLSVKAMQEEELGYRRTESSGERTRREVVAAHPKGSGERIRREVAVSGKSFDQATLAALRAKIPYRLALEVCTAAEVDLVLGNRHVGATTLF